MAQQEFVWIKGQVRDAEKKEAIPHVMIRSSDNESSAFGDKDGFFRIKARVKKVIQLHFRHQAFHAFTKDIRYKNEDSITVNVYLKEKPNVLDPVAVLAVQKPETLVGKPNYSVYDFDFYEDKFILLTADKSLSKAQLRFSDDKGNILSTLPLPGAAGTASCFFHDYEGYTDLICSDTIFRLDLLQNDFLLMWVSRTTFNQGIKPVADTANLSLYFSDQWEKYPLFNYYFNRTYDTSSFLLRTISNDALMKIYNLEYYYLPPAAQLHARRMASKYKTDKRVIAALMSGFTESMFYEPLYAPLFVLNDTVCVFNHYTDHIYHFDKKNKLIDSVGISYHHPKNWREWKKQLFVDKFTNKVYAFFSRDGHHYLKEINFQTGKEVKTYKLKHHSAEKIKIRDGYVYYVYRPFDSTQERFLYRERIE